MSTIASSGFNPAKTQTQNLGGTMQMLAQANKMGENKVNALGEMLQGASDIGQASNTNKLNQFLNNYGGLSAEETRAGASQFGTVSDQAEKALHRNVESKSLGEKRQHQEDLQKASQVFQTEEREAGNVFQAGENKKTRDFNDLTNLAKTGDALNLAFVKQDMKNEAEDAKTGSWINSSNGMITNTKTGKSRAVEGWLERGGYGKGGKGSSVASQSNTPLTGYTKTAMASETPRTQAMFQDIQNNGGNVRVIKGTKGDKYNKAVADKYELNGQIYNTIPDMEDAYKAGMTNSPDAIAIKNQEDNHNYFNFGSDAEGVVNNVSPINELKAKVKGNSSDIPNPKPVETAVQKKGFEKLQREKEEREQGFFGDLFSRMNSDNYKKRIKNLNTPR